MTSPGFHDRPPAPVVLPQHQPSLPTAAGYARLLCAAGVAVHAGEDTAGSATATSPTSARPAQETAGVPATQREFYQYFGLALLALIAIAILVAARG